MEYKKFVEINRKTFIDINSNMFRDSNVKKIHNDFIANRLMTRRLKEAEILNLIFISLTIIILFVFSEEWKSSLLINNKDDLTVIYLILLSSFSFIFKTIPEVNG